MLGTFSANVTTTKFYLALNIFVHLSFSYKKVLIVSPEHDLVIKVSSCVLLPHLSLSGHISNTD